MVSPDSRLKAVVAMKLKNNIASTRKPKIKRNRNGIDLDKNPFLSVVWIGIIKSYWNRHPKAKIYSQYNLILVAV